MALRNNSLPSESNLQWFLSKPCDISAFERHFDFPAKRCCWSLLARNTLSRIAPDDSARSSLLSSLYSTAGASVRLLIDYSAHPHKEGNKEASKDSDKVPTRQCLAPRAFAS